MMPKRPKATKASVQNGDQFRFEKEGDPWFYNWRATLDNGADPLDYLHLQKGMSIGEPEWQRGRIPVDTVACVIATPHDHPGKDKVAFTVTFDNGPGVPPLVYVFQTFWTTFRSDTRYV